MLSLYFVNYLRPCLLSLSIFVFHYQFFDFPVFVCRSLSFFSHCLLLSFVLPLRFVNSLRLCSLSLSFFAFLCQFFYFSVFLSRFFSFLRHCCPIVFRSSSVFR